MPLVTAEQVTETMKLALSEQDFTAPELFTEFPSDLGQVSEGFYVARLYQEERNVKDVFFGVEATYDITDKLEVYLIFGQQNTMMDKYLNFFTSYVDNELFGEYPIREYSIEQVYEESSERYLVSIRLTRHELI